MAVRWTTRPGAEGENLASGAILINEDGRINLGGNGSDNSDTTENERINLVADATSPPSDWGPYDATEIGKGIVSFNDNYQLFHHNRWGTGPDEVYDYISYGVWASANRSFTGRILISPISGGPIFTDGGAFALVKDGAPPTAADGIGTASFTGNQHTYISRSGRRDLIIEGRANATINFAKGTAELDIWNRNHNLAYYTVKDITVDGNILSGGRGSTENSLAAITRNFAISLHAEIFGDNAQEIVGTVKVNGRDSANRSSEYRTAFGMLNEEYR